MMFKGYIKEVVKEAVKELEKLVEEMDMEKEERIMLEFLISIYQKISDVDELPRWGSKERALDSRTVDIHSPDNEGTLCNVYLQEIENQKERLGLKQIVVQHPIDPGQFEDLILEVLKLQGDDEANGLEFIKDLIINQFKKEGDLLGGAIEGVEFQLDFDSIPEKEELMEMI